MIALASERQRLNSEYSLAYEMWLTNFSPYWFDAWLDCLRQLKRLDEEEFIHNSSPVQVMP